MTQPSFLMEKIGKKSNNKSPTGPGLKLDHMLKNISSKSTKSSKTEKKSKEKKCRKSPTQNFNSNNILPPILSQFKLQKRSLSC